jgi:hypothetical protein
MNFFENCESEIRDYLLNCNHVELKLADYIGADMCVAWWTKKGINIYALKHSHSSLFFFSTLENALEAISHITNEKYDTAEIRNKLIELYLLEK